MKSLFMKYGMLVTDDLMGVMNLSWGCGLVQLSRLCGPIVWNYHPVSVTGTWLKSHIVYMDMLCTRFPSTGGALSILLLWGKVAGRKTTTNVHQETTFSKMKLVRFLKYKYCNCYDAYVL